VNLEYVTLRAYFPKIRNELKSFQRIETEEEYCVVSQPVILRKENKGRIVDTYV